MGQVKAGAEPEFQKDQPVKHRLSQSRKWEGRPLLDDQGRRSSTQELYRHAGEQSQACQNVAAVGITHLHPDLLLSEARSLGNQVLCMIAEYHLTGSAQGLSSLSPILLEVVRTLLPPVEDYIMGGTFQETRDVRVVK